MLYVKRIRQPRVVEQLAGKAQRGDARPRLDVDEAHALLGHKPRHLEQMHGEGNEEARGRPVGEDARGQAVVAGARLGRRQQRGEDVDDAAQGRRGGAPERLVDAARARDGPRVEAAGRGGAARAAEARELGLVVAQVVRRHVVAAGDEVAAVRAGEVAEAVVHHHEHLLGVAAGAEHEEEVVVIAWRVGGGGGAVVVPLKGRLGPLRCAATAEDLRMARLRMVSPENLEEFKRPEEGVVFSR